MIGEIGLRRRDTERKVRTPEPDRVEEAALPLDRLEALLHTSPAGLSQTEAQRRLEMYGYNELAEEMANPLL